MYEISILRNVITFIYGAIDDLYQKSARFSKLKFFFFFHMLYSINCSTLPYSKNQQGFYIIMFLMISKVVKI
jgi:hypothetical protein